MKRVSDVWNVSTFIEYSKLFIEAMVTLSSGSIGKKIRADVLWQHKEGLYWWAVRFIPQFTTIYAGWHSQLVAHIHLLARKHELEQHHRPKSELAATELELFYRQLSSLHSGVDNWKQHYAAWLLVYITGVRPGSFTVCPGYEKGATLGASGLTRPTDETLRWSDVNFFRFPDVEGIAVQVTFSYLKNQRDPFSSRLIEGKKKFTFIPTRGERYEFDVSAVLLALAFSRGLFSYDTIELLHNDELVYVPKVEAVNRQAVFLAADQTGELDINTPMREFSLNPKLQQMCRFVGLLEHNTIYAFRRTAITEVRRDQGTEFARQMAGHKPNTNSITAYDVQGVSDVDITSLRVEGGDSPGKFSRQAIRDAFAQAKVSRVGAEYENVSFALQEQLQDRATAAMQADEEFISIERELDDLLTSLASVLGIEPLELIHGVFEDYRSRLIQAEIEDGVSKLDEILKRRKVLRKKLRSRYMKEQKVEMLEAHKKVLKVTKQKSGAPHGRGRQPALLRDIAAGSVDQDLDTSEQTALNALTTDLNGDDNEDADLNLDAVNESMEGIREEPIHWRELQNEVIVTPEGNGDGQSTIIRRLEFINTLVALTSVANSDLICIFCGLDDTVPQGSKDQLWTLAKLDRHLKSGFHTRKQEIIRAATNTAVDGKLNCPLCNKSMQKRNFYKHVETDHSEQV